MSRDDRYAEPLSELEAWRAITDAWSAARPRNESDEPESVEAHGGSVRAGGTQDRGEPLERSGQPDEVVVLRGGVEVHGTGATAGPELSTAPIEQDPSSLDVLYEGARREATVDADLEPSSLEVLYQRTVEDGSAALLGPELASELKETAALASETRRPVPPPPRLPATRVPAPTERRTPPLKAPPLKKRASVAPPRRPKTAPALGARKLERDVLRDLSRVSQRPAPLAEDDLVTSTPRYVGPEQASSAHWEESSSGPTLTPITVGARASIAAAAPPETGGRSRWLRAAAVAAVVSAAAAAAVIAVRAPTSDQLASPATVGLTAASLSALTGDEGCGGATDDATASRGVCSAKGEAGLSLATPSSPRDGSEGDSGAEGAAHEAAPGGSALGQSPQPGALPPGWLPGPTAGHGQVPEASAATADGNVAQGAGSGSEAEALDSRDAAALPSDDAAAPPFDQASAGAALGGATATAAAACRPPSQGTYRVPVAVTFAPSGRVTTALVTGSVFQGTDVGGCIAQFMKAVQVPPFSGGPVTVLRTVTLQ